MPNSRASSTASQPPISRRPSRDRGGVAGRRWSWRRPCGGGLCQVPAARLPTLGAPPAQEASATAWPTRCSCRRASPCGGLVIIHGAGSRKENHHDFARGGARGRLRRGRASTCAATARARARSTGACSTTSRRSRRCCRGPGRAARVEPRRLPRDRRGGAVGAAAVVAICPASAAQLAAACGAATSTSAPTSPRSRRSSPRTTSSLVVARSAIPLLLLHAEGDERVPVEHSIALHAASPAPGTQLVVVPGGHHRSVQHDPELQARALAWLQARWRAGGRRVDSADSGRV